MKKKVIVIISILILFSECAFFAATPSLPLDRFQTTVALKVKHVSSGSANTSYDLYEYYVGNKRYTTHGPSMAWVPKGEKYLLKYDKLHPENQEDANIVTEHPVFLPSEVTNYTYGTLIKVSERQSVLKYKYTILGKEYETEQYLADGDAVRNHPQLVNGAEFLVEYWVKNPERVILYMDKPKKDSMSYPVSPDIHVLRPVWDSSIPVLLPNPQIIKSQPGWQ